MVYVYIMNNMNLCLYRCLDVDDCEDYNKAAVQVYPCHVGQPNQPCNSKNQQWTVCAVVVVVIVIVVHFSNYPLFLRPPPPIKSRLLWTTPCVWMVSAIRVSHCHIPNSLSAPSLTFSAPILCFCCSSLDVRNVFVLFLSCYLPLLPAPTASSLACSLPPSPLLSFSPLLSLLSSSPHVFFSCNHSNLLAIDYAFQNNHKHIVELLQNPDDATMLLMDKLKF